MLNTKIGRGLSLAAVIASLIFACQDEVIQSNRQVTTGQAAKSENKNENDAKPAEKKAETPAGNTSASTPPPTNYTMAWDVSADAGIVSYKVFVVPPDRNSRFPGKTDVPVQIKNYPIANLQKIGQKYSVVVSSDEIKTALGATVVNPTAYCFTIVSVNGVGNSSHSPVFCP